MADGSLKITPAEARARADELKKISSEIEMLLNEVSTKMEEIDSVEHGVYQGDNRPAQLRGELDSFRAMFNKAHEQIDKYANDILKVTTTAENE
jgi:uncharacterized coiled-coil DUF342 family protein